MTLPANPVTGVTTIVLDEQTYKFNGIGYELVTNQVDLESKAALADTDTFYVQDSEDANSYKAVRYGDILAPTTTVKEW